jgi:hypothetical protein
MASSLAFTIACALGASQVKGSLISKNKKSNSVGVLLCAYYNAEVYRFQPPAYIGIFRELSTSRIVVFTGVCTVNSAEAAIINSY